MLAAGSIPLASYDLPPAEVVAARATPRGGAKSSFPEPLLARNALWFCRLRWGAIAILVVYGLSGLFSDRIEHVGLLLNSRWPLVIAGILVAANLAFIGHARLLLRSGARRGARLNMWSQLVLDLVAHTFVVHFLGSLETYALFVYLFHIVLSCMFFSRLQSLAVVAFACVLFASCVGLETAGVVSSSSVYADVGRAAHVERFSWMALFNVASAMAIWFVVWYMSSYLVALVRERDAERAETNRRLVGAQEERTRHLLRTTHELKAPFAAIHANTQLMLKGHCGELPEEGRDVLLRIATRSRRLTRVIQKMLQLANLRSTYAGGGDARPEEDLDLVAVIRESMAHVQPMADERRVVIVADEEDLHPARVRRFAREHLRMLLDNLLSNAITYSHEGGSVRVECGRPSDGRPTVTVEDHGIGIPQHKLALIFNEYYRTDEGARFNKESTGLGLTIVSHIAQRYGIALRVESRLDEGTRFLLRFPGGARGEELPKHLTAENAENSTKHGKGLRRTQSSRGNA